MNSENNKTNGSKRKICLKQEEKEKVIKHDVIDTAEMAERILDISRNVQKDFRKFINSFKRQTEKNP